MSDEKDSASERVEIPILEEYERPSLFSRIGSKHKSSQSTITTVTIDLEVKEIIIIKIDKHRELHLLNREDEKLYERIRDWMNDHPVATLQDTVDKFSSEPTGDAIAKVLHNFPFPDFILKFNIDEREKLTKKKPSKKLKRKNFERLLLKSGLIVEIEQDAARDNEFFVKLYAPFHQLCEQAQQIKLKMRLNAKIAEDIDIVLPKPKFHSIITKYFTHIVDFKKQAAFFRISKLRQFQGAEPDKSEGEIILNFFSMARRNLLVHRMIVTANQMNKRVDLGGIPIIVKRNIDSLSLKKLSKEKVFTKHYPLHDGPDNAEKGTPLSYMNTRAYLNEKWVKGWKRQPIEAIRQYFGEKLALYFSWLGFYTTWLFLASIGGVAVVIFGLADALNVGPLGDDVNSVSILWDNALTAPYAFFMAVWATLFLETWKRNMAKIQYDWDILDFKKDELPRPEFYGTTLRRSPITLKQEIHFPFSQRFRKFFISGFVVFFTLGIVVVTIGVLLIFPKIYIEKKIGNLSSFVTSFVNLVTILILSMIYQNVARWLTNFENHKTYSLYEDSLIIKTYLFDFFNNYSALFYIMIFKQYIYEIIPLEELKVTSCEYGSCMSDLTIQLAIILIGKQFFGQFKEVLYPWIISKTNKQQIIDELNYLKSRYAKSGRTNKEIPQWAQDERLAHVDNAIRSEYEEMVVQFGFISLFGPAFPLAALFAWINNTSEIRFDAFKYVSTLQRPVGYQVQDIGMWENIMGIISQLAVLTNAIIIAFHSNWMKSTFQKFTGDNEDLLLIARLTFILVFEHLVFIIKLIFAYLISDIPKSIRVATEREHYIVKLTLEDEAPALDEYLAASNDTSLFDENWELKLPKKRNMISNIFDKTKTGTNNFKDIGDDGGSLIE